MTGKSFIPRFGLCEVAAFVLLLSAGLASSCSFDVNLFILSFRPRPTREQHLIVGMTLVIVCWLAIRRISSTGQGWQGSPTRRTFSQACRGLYGAIIGIVGYLLHFGSSHGPFDLSVMCAWAFAGIVGVILTTRTA
jgi:hypothetical protein